MRKKQRMLKAAELRHNGCKQREIAAILGVSERTVRTYLKTPPAVRKRTARGSLLDPYKPYIDSLIDEEPFYNCARLFAALQEMGYSGRLTILREYTAESRVRALTRAVNFAAADFDS
jgi:transposase